jgi:hypothetical protein
MPPDELELEFDDWLAAGSIKRSRPAWSPDGEASPTMRMTGNESGTSDLFTETDCAFLALNPA